MTFEEPRIDVCVDIFSLMREIVILYERSNGDQMDDRIRWLA